MARKRNISTDISTDPKVDQLSDFEALLYTWMIPHAGDDGAITRKSENFARLIRLRVMPGRKTTDDRVLAAIEKMISLGLLIDEGEEISFPIDTYYKYQHYIPANRRKSAQNRASPSLSPTLSLNPSGIKNNVQNPDVIDLGFERFWEAYPKRVNKKRAKEFWLKEAGLSSELQSVIMPALEKQKAWRERTRADNAEAFIPQWPDPERWLKDRRWQDEIPHIREAGLFAIKNGLSQRTQEILTRGL